jgi:hypothetical protein
VVSSSQPKKGSDVAHLGIDLSSYQGDISPAVAAGLKNAGIEFAFVKATQGGGTNGYTNPDAHQQVNALRVAGIRVGLYHFVTVADTVSDQVQHFLPFAQALGGSDLPLALDIEQTDPAGWADLATKVMAIAMQIEAEPTVVRCPLALLYANLNFYRNLVGFPWGRLVWLADPNPGAPHEPCLVLQSAPRPEGGLSNVDPDVFQGTEAQWVAFVSSGQTPVVTGGTGTAPQPAPVPSPPVPTPTAPTPKEFDMSTLPTLQSGSKGDEVKSVQALLKAKFNQVGVTVDGDFGPVTESAVKTLQAFFKVVDDGVVGPTTWDLLLAA